jgi:hypothetical protein
LANRSRRRAATSRCSPLPDKVKALGGRPRTVAMDKGYDNNRMYDECRDRGVAPIIPLRKGQDLSAHDDLARNEDGRFLPPPLRGRARVRPLEHEYALTPLCPRGLALRQAACRPRDDRPPRAGARSGGRGLFHSLPEGGLRRYVGEGGLSRYVEVADERVRIASSALLDALDEPHAVSVWKTVSVECVAFLIRRLAPEIIGVQLRVRFEPEAVLKAAVARVAHGATLSGERDIANPS